MGNSVCYSQDEVRKKECLPLRIKRAMEIKKKLKMIVLKGAQELENESEKTEMLECFLDFFKDKLLKVIQKYEFPKPGKDFLQSGYVLSFANITDITQQIHKDDGDVDSQLLKSLMDDINELKEKSLFYLILKEFDRFYKQLVLSKKDKLDDITISPNLHHMSDTKSFIKTQLPLEIQEKHQTIEFEDCFFSKRKLSALIKEDKCLIDYLIISIINLFEFLKQTIYLTYSDIIKEYISLNDIQKYLQNSLFFQKLVQHYIYDKELCIGQLIEKIIPLKYQNQQIQYEGQILERQQTLDISLYPEPGQQTMIKEFEEDIFAHDFGKLRQEQYFRNSSRMSIIEMQNKIMNAIEQIEKENLPYKELFIILKQMFEEVKPYRIFLLIQKLSDDIVDIYLQSRPQDQQNKYRELILAEDNKLSIILFLLHKFQDSSKCNLNRLFYKLRFMMDYNQVLDDRIKYEMDQSFVRFYACLEMMIQTP
ncbi:unnamed protein product [Paramecium pentaurelia]|uniref:Uncharacterized protein n=1 Tax=Paramecium pentaurelia TaxID=43138 RepID=A0A8S1SSX3_9CILI|nr:unnamed protein product [Paramecium pentaurelia]